MSAGMSVDDVEVIFEAVKDAATKTAWAKGVALARTAELRFARQDGSDWHYHVVTPSNGIAVPCMINPEEEDWQCRSGEGDDPSRFIVALVIGLQQSGGTIEAPELRTLRVGYFFAPSNDPRPALKVERAFFDPDKLHKPAQRELPLTGSLKAGAAKPPAGCSAHIEAGDLDLDPWLCHLVEGGHPIPIPATSMTSVFALLTAHRLPAFWQDAPVTIHKSPYPEVIAITDRNDGVLVRIAGEGTAQHFANGAVLNGGSDKGSSKGAREGVSLWLPPPSTTAELPAEARWLREGRYFKAAELAYLVSEVLPALSPRFTWQDNGRNLPLLVAERPRPAFFCEAEGDLLSVTPKLVYGDPAIARVEQKTLVLVPPLAGEQGNEDAPRAEVPKRERNREYALTDLMNRKLSMVPGDTLTFEGSKAMATAEAIARFARQHGGLTYSRHPQTGRWRQDALSGTAGPHAPEGTTARTGGLNQFTSHGSVTPHITLGSQDFTLAFTVAADGVPTAKSEDGQRQVSAGEVFEAFRKGQSMIPLKGGGFAQLPTDWLGQYGPVLMQLWQAKRQGGEDQPLPRSLWPRYEELATTLDPSFKASPEVRALAEELAGPVPTVSMPAGVNATLRPYQAEGYNWLKQRQRLQLGAILADDMGLGKTLQTICIMPTTEPTLVVCPTSVMFNWQKEIARFRPALSSRLYHGSQRSLAGIGVETGSPRPEEQVVLTSYGTLRRDAEELAAIPWGLVVLDEAQTIKNPNSQVSQAAFTLKGDFKVALTGTPIENSLMDVWSQFQFLLPGFLGDHKPFAASLGSAGEAQQVAALRQQIAPYILRRTKAEVLTDLPDKIESLLHYELSPDERSRYEALYAAGQPKVQELLMGGGKLEVLEIILRLRQACCHPALGPGIAKSGGAESPRGKLRPLLAKLDQLKASAGGKKTVKSLVFSQWTQFLAIIEEQLGSHGYSTCRLDGSTTDRESVVAKFQNEPDVEVMLISLKAGSTGLNLTAAENVFIMDPWWNPAAENQAADRAYRIGQKKTVQVFRLVAVDTIEENIVLLKDAKQRLADAAISGAPEGQADSGGLAHADLASLFNRST